MPPIVGILLGVILLLVLIFSIAYASGWAPRTAGPSGEGVGPGVGGERKAQIAIAITLALGLLILIYGLNEPNRQAEAYERQRETSIERGAHYFAQYCYGCHGYNGQGAIVPGQGVLAANLTLRKATGNPDDDKKLFDFLTKTISRGRPNTPMPAWGLADGGSLQPEEINELAVFIMNGDFSQVQALVAPGAPTPEVPGAGTGPGAAARALINSKGCGACHTIQEIPTARGTIGPNLTDLGQVAGTMKPGMSAKDYIRESILQPNAFIVPGFPSPSPMPPFTVGPTSTGTQFTEEDLDLLIDYLASLGTPEQGQGGGTSGGGAAPAGGGAAPAAGGDAGQAAGAPPTAQPSGTGPAGGGAQPNPASAPGGQVTTPVATQAAGTPSPVGAPTTTP
jgi:mono/diheme cytochrome c family protein